MFLRHPLNPNVRSVAAKCSINFWEFMRISVLSGSRFVSLFPGCPLRHIFAMRTPTKGPIQALEVFTLPETNMVPENMPFQKETSLPTIDFQGLCSKEV